MRRPKFRKEAAVSLSLISSCKVGLLAMGRNLHGSPLNKEISRSALPLAKKQARHKDNTDNPARVMRLDSTRTLLCLVLQAACPDLSGSRPLHSRQIR